LYNFIQSKFYPDLKEETFRWRVYELRQEKLIVPIKRGIYKLYSKEETYIPDVTNIQKKINRLLNNTYTEFTYCSWNSSWLNSFSRHQIFTNTLFIEVDTDLVQSVFHLLNDNSFKNVYIAPDENIIDNYISENKESIVVKPIISKSPTYKISNVPVPYLEKMLVDLFCEDKLLRAFQGHEQVTIFRNAFDEYKIDISRLINYSRRRKKEHQIKDFLIQNDILKKELFA
jgi:hypothetical protein